jgi:sulfatase maturation enzyme AslB (radical SAM superfamily)
MFEETAITNLDLSSPDAGPKPTTSLQRRRSPLADPQIQLSTLAALKLPPTRHPNDFATALQQHGWQSLQPTQLDIFQINLGKLCNMTCRHCHVDAGPDRAEVMDRETIEACLEVHLSLILTFAIWLISVLLAANM